MTRYTLQSPHTKQLGLLARSPLFGRFLEADLDLSMRVPPSRRYVHHDFGGVARQVALPVTFTPFASVKPCSARCIFCSETLRHKESRRLSASLRPGTDYADGLGEAFTALRGLPISLSLSGLEATDDPDWLCTVLDAADHFVAGGGELGTKVLYTNANGLTAHTNGATLLPRLRDFDLTRAEVSRHAVHQSANDAIMRFRPNEPARDNAIFEDTVRAMTHYVPVRLVCVIQDGGVDDAESMRAYLAWARGLGVTDVVFREFSRLGNDYLPNKPYRRIERARVAIEDLIRSVWPENQPIDGDFQPRTLVSGYYYWNLRSRWHKEMDVTFETSDYREMKQRHRSGVVHKLIYHADGTLNSDWDPDKAVLLRTGQWPAAV